MSSDRNQPQKYDIVLGGQSQTTKPNYGVVLGGLTGVRQRLQSESPAHRIAALTEAMQQESKGLNLVIRALSDSVPEVQWAAYQLLRDRPETKVKLAIALFSDSGVNYRKLQNLLSAKRWQAADELTTDVIKAICGIPSHKRLTSEHFEDFPCQDLGIIDRLWLKHSQNRFGFSLQIPIWQKCVQARWDKGEVWSMFGDRVGWRVSNILSGRYHWKRNHEITFSSNAPLGHLPFVNGIFTIEAICDRFLTCNQE